MPNLLFDNSSQRWELSFNVGRGETRPLYVTGKDLPPLFFLRPRQIGCKPPDWSNFGLAAGLARPYCLVGSSITAHSPEASLQDRQLSFPANNSTSQTSGSPDAIRTTVPLGISWGPPRNLLRRIERVLFSWTPKLAPRQTTSQLYKPTISFSDVTDAPQTKWKRRSTSAKDVPNQIAVISIATIAMGIVFHCPNCGHQVGADQIAAIDLKTRASDREITLYTPQQDAKNLPDLRIQRRLESGTGDASV